MKLNKKRIGIVSAWLISLLIVATFVYVVFAQTASTFWITEGVYSGAPSYTIWNEDSTYYAKTAYGQIPSWGSGTTNASLIMQNAFDALTSGRTWKEKVLLRGDFEIDTTLKLPSYLTVELQGKITLADNSNINMIETKETTTNHTDWFGGIIDGNHDTQSSGKGMDLDSFCYGTVKNVFFTRIEGHAIELSAIYDESEGVIINENTFINIHGDAIRTESNVKDSYFCYNRMEQLYSFGIASTGLLTSVIGFNTISAEARSGISIASSNNVVVIGNDVDSCGENGIILSTCNLMPNSIIDNTVYNNLWHGIVLDDSNNTLVSNNIIRSSGYDGINIQGASMFNTISNNMITDDATPTQDYGIQEQNTADYNIITNNIALGSVNFDIKTVGANTEVHLCWNGTTWIS